MHADQFIKAEELIAALGVLARAQEFGGRARELGADDNELSGLTARVQDAEHDFRAIYRPAK